MRLPVIALWVLLTCAACSSNTKESLYTEGVKQLNASNPSGAVVYFKSALEKDGNFNDARYQLARAYLALGKYEQAEKEFSKVLTQNPSREEAILELARVLNLEGKGSEGAKLAEGYLAKHPDHPEALEILGTSYLVLSRYQEAEGFLSRAIAAGQGSARIALASLKLATGQPARAKALLEEVVQAEPRNLKALYLLASVESGSGSLDRAAAVYTRILGVEPAETTARYKLGLIQIEKGDLARAEASADQMIAKYPRRGDGHRLKGLVNYQRHRYDDAITSLQASLKYGPTLEAYHFLGLCFYNQGQFEMALSQFRKILDAVPESRQARLITAQILIRQKRLDDAVVEVQRVLRRDNKDALAHELLGTAYMTQGHFEDGLAELNRATALDAKMASAHLKKGFYYFSRGKESLGESELASAVSATPDRLGNRLLLASHYQRRGKSAKALAVLREGLTGGREDAAIDNAMAALQFATGNKQGGLNALDAAKKADPSFSATYHNLAAYYAASGDYPRAIAELGSLLLRSPSDVRGMLALAALYDLAGREAEAAAQYRLAAQTGKTEALLAEVGYLRKKGKRDEALKVLDEVIRTDPKGPALEAKGRLLTEALRYKEALKVFDQLEGVNRDAGVSLKIATYLAMGEGGKAVEEARGVVDHEPGSARGYLLLASVYRHQKDLASALREAMNGVRAEPRSVEAKLVQGGLHEARGEFDKALACYQGALSLAPDHIAAQFARAALLDRTGRKKEAAGLYRSTLQSDASFVPALNNLACLLADGYGSPQEALRLAVAAYRLDPGNPQVMDTTGYALLKNGRRADAVRLLERAASLSTEQSVQYHLALAYQANGDRARAQQAVKKALSLGAGPDVNAVRMLLAELR
ncbi:PEP-CTERM system TPR-repeat protein PrsT [Geomonas sp. Red32]|uniref:XrtA/PEP-CTERM system TPR-repeat protein PrsT n=1 Tax=Geomonas sp. Red32 TaxID=2912856 RepID=UPI00202CBD97|nr:XrtA/PEP-CTERM system TPR-repeat protein PrsT [Geomonas sp. Red32]MCM0083352.1 PEP-CTERM system TPR-repeat protein PrsT [Geomonas sp. Red32]